MSLISDIAQTRTFRDFSTGLTTLFVSLNATERKLDEDEFRVLLRCFAWYSHAPRFEDLYDVSLAAMPVLGGYAVHMTKKGETDDTYPLRHVKRCAEILAEYLDEASLSLSERDDEPGHIVTFAASVMEDELKKARRLLSADPLVAKKERGLKTLAKTRPGLRALLRRSPFARITELKEAFRRVSIAMNDLFNLTRVSGVKVLPVIEKALRRMHPVDQDYLLHGLDAFPRNKKVLALYRRVLAKNRSPYLAKQVAKYAKRVQRGMRTTGWEQ